MEHSPARTLSFHTANVFTTVPFTGNPLAIVQDADALTDKQMQLIAREFNLPETIFVQQAEAATNTAKVRIFTPEHELPFAGHPTIGCAIFLAELQQQDADFRTEIKLEELAGLVPVLVTRSAGVCNATLTAPVIPTPTNKIDQNSTIELDKATAASVLGLDTNDIASQPHAHAGGPTFIFIPLVSNAALSKAMPIQPLCNELTKAYGATGIYLYHLRAEKNEIDARMFAPDAGIPEDPATGSAAALLASQLNLDAQLKDGTNEFVLRQGYDMGRPSDMQLSISVNSPISGPSSSREGVKDSQGIAWVKVAGSSTAISAGTINVPLV